MADFFEEHERCELLRFGDNAFEELLQRLHRAQTGKAEREHKREEHRCARADVERKFISVLEQHKIYATLEEIADLYISDEKKMVLDFSESRELAVLRRATPCTPMEYTGLRWSLFKSPNRHLAKGQDFCYLEVMKPYVATNGRRAWAKLSHSIESTICPDFTKTLNVNRGQLYYCGVFFVESSQPGVLNGFFYYNVDRTRIPAVLAPAIMKARGKSNAALINHYAKMSRLLAGASKAQAATLAQQLKADDRCGACSNRMPKWSTKHTCHFCTAFMCKKCSKIVAKNYRVANIGRKQACFACADAHGVKLTHMDDEDSASSSHSRSSSSSASTARDTGTSHTTSGSFASSVASSPAASSASWQTSRSTSRTSSEPLYRHQQYRELQQQRQAELLRQRTQSQGVPQRMRLDDDPSSPTESNQSEHCRRPESARQQQQQLRQQELLQRRLRRDPFAAGRPIKAMSEQGYCSRSSTRPESSSSMATTAVRKPQPSEEAPVVAALDLSYLSSFK